MSLYHTHRPKTFDEMIGCTDTAQTLAEMVKREKVPHFILFEGPSGTGKTSLARILADALECADFDLKEMNSASYRGIDTIRELQQNIGLSPAMGKCRVYILEECHALTGDAQDCMLKMLEDTPSHVYFFLTTTDPIRLKKAILTRACRMVVRSLTESELEALCDRVVKKEKLKITSNIRTALVAAADGSARTLLVLLDQIINLPPDKQEAAIEAKKNEEKEFIDLCRALMNKTPWKATATIIKNLKGQPEDARRAILGYARNTLLADGSKLMAYEILRNFERNFYDSGTAGLTLACYETLHGN